MRFVQIILLVFCAISIRSSNAQRSKRFLTFPRTSPTRMQIISGIGIPVDLELESVTIGYVFKCEYFLPENATNYLNYLADPFDLTTRPISGFFERKKRMLEEPKPTELPPKADMVKSAIGFDAELNQKYEKYEVQPEVIESRINDEPEPDYDGDDENELSDADYWNREDDSASAWQRDPLRPKAPQNLATSRWTVYKGLAALAESKGLSGKSCVMRSICESAQASFDYTNGILGELMHIIMTPSSTQDQTVDHADLEYLKAEEMGKRGDPCDQVFRECRVSILDQFTGVYTPMMDVINRILS